ncbi:hypothetical protein AGR8A_pAt30117 [Agrobacterium fabrum str. J-07]|nr:hypothetical protein AGR8A_pAt30117 [Agrobacterium fabrum str. J-07]
MVQGSNFNVVTSVIDPQPKLHKHNAARRRPDIGARVQPATAPHRGLAGIGAELMQLDLAMPDHTTLCRRARTWACRSANMQDGYTSPGFVHVLIDSRRWADLPVTRHRRPGLRLEPAP